MQKNSIVKIFSLIEQSDSLDPTIFGVLEEKIASGILKYKPTHIDVTQITAFYNDDELTSIGFLTKPKIFMLSELADKYGEPKISYSFRDNLTRFEFFSNNDKFEKIYCDVDNEWENQGSYFSEKDPKGNVATHNDVNLDGFSIELKF